MTTLNLTPAQSAARAERIAASVSKAPPITSHQVAVLTAMLRPSTAETRVSAA